MNENSTFKPFRIKKFLYGSILLFLLSGVNYTFAANRFSVATGNWNSTSTWSATSGGASGATVPVAGDVVTVGGGFTVTVNANTASLGSLTINSGSSLNVSSNFTVSSTTITINGTYINNSTGTITGTISVNASGTYQHNIDGGTIPSASWDPASTCLITGIANTMLTGGWNQAFGNFTWNCTGQAIYPTGFTPSTMSVQGNLTVAATGSSMSGGVATYDFSVANGSSPQDVTIGGDLIITGGTYRICYDYRNTTATINGNIYVSGGSLQLNSSDASSYTGTINLAGNLSISGGILDLSKTNTAGRDGVININGDFSQTGGTITETGSATANAINFTGSTTQTYSSTGGTLSNMVNFFIESGSTVDFGTSVIGSSSGTFTIASGGYMITANTAGITISGATGTIQVTGTRTYSSGANYEYNGTKAQYTGNGLTMNNPRGVTISNSVGVTFSSQTYMDYLDISSGSIVNLGTFTGHTASALYLSGIAFTTGSYGSTSSAATNKDNTYFAATVGYLTLTPVTQSYFTTTDIILPCGVTSITVEAWGGGGQGSTRNSSGVGGGGGGGAYAKGDVPVTAGSYWVTVGGGGTSQNGSQVPGGDSYFGDGLTVKAKGGNSVSYNDINGALGGYSISCNGTTKYSGGNGANGSSGNYSGGGGSSAGTALDGNNGSGLTGATAPTGGGDGGNGRNSNNSGRPGTSPGGGGGGAYRTSGTKTGGAGSSGQVNISYSTIIPSITLGSNPSVCQGSSSATLNYSATTGCPDKYLINFDAAAITAGFVNVESTTLPSSPITIVVPSGVTPTTYNATLTVINSNGFPSSDYAITITVAADNWTGAASTAWENGGNWCGGVPSANTDVTIPSVTNQPIIGASITGLCNNITINSGATVTIAAGTSPGTPGGLLTIGKILTNNAGTSGIVVKSSSSNPNGSLIFSQPGLNSSVQATVEMYSKAFKDDAATVKYKWQFFGIPLRTIVASPTFDGSYVREMHENDTPLHWEQLGNTSVLTSFTGYEITQITPTTIYFQGVLENRDYTSGQLSFTTGKSYPGQHLIGNPYTAAIDISKINFGNQMIKTVYLYNTGSSEDWANKTIDSTSASYNNYTPGQYIAVPQAHAGDAGLQHQIPSMQAFLVRAMSNDPAATVSIPYSSVNTIVKNTTIQRSKASEKTYMLIDVKGKKYGDRMWIFTNPNCTRNFDNGWDGEKIFGSSLTPQIFAIESDGDYQVNSVDDMDNSDIGFWAGIDSTYTMTFTNSNTAQQYAGIYLLDLQKNTLTDISQSGTSYSFTALPTDSIEMRFKIITRPNIINSLDTYNQANSQLRIFSSQNNIIIQNNSEVAGKIMIYDIAGHTIQTTTFIANGVTTIPMNLPAGVYLAKGKTSKSEVTERLLIRK